MKFLTTLLLLCVALIASAQSDNQATYSNAQNELNKRHYTQARSLCNKIIGTGDSKYSAKCQSLLRQIAEMESEEKVINEISRAQKSDYISVPSMVCLPYGTTTQEVSVKASGNWNAHSKDAWIKTKTSKRNLTITAVEQNLTTKKKTSVITVECGEVTRTITVEQEGAPELLEYKSKYLKVPYNGGQFIVDINTNTKWKVDYADWYKAFPLNKDSTKMVITIDKNTKNEDRNGTIMIKSDGGTVYDEMEIYQYANESKIFAVVDSIIQFRASGDTIYVPVISDNPTWTESDRPSWCMAEKICIDTLRLIVTPNENFFMREGFVNIKSNNRVAGIFIRQDASDFPDYMTEKILGGRNVSVGITAGYKMPFVNSTSSGAYTGSVINYSLGDRRENVNYSKMVGYTLGLISDFRLFKNWYVKTEIDFSHLQYTNSFTGNVHRYFNQLVNTVYEGVFQNSFQEDYKFNYLSIPVLASYRLVFDNKHSLHIDIGPAIDYALSGKMKFAGNSSSDDVYPHTVIYNQVGPVSGNRSSVYMRYTGEVDLFSRKVTCETSSTTNGLIKDQQNDYDIEASPYNRVSFGLKSGLTYEYLGWQLGLVYTHMLNDMSNNNFWESERMPIFGQTGDVMMAGYKHRINTIEVKLCYIFRYKK